MGRERRVATLQNDSNKSVHYIVGQDGKVGQFVLEGDTAWHAGNWFYNQKSVGIEHVGYYQQSYPDAEYAASAELVKYLASKYGVVKDRVHIVGHDQIPNGNEMPEDSAPCEESPATCETGSSYGGADNHRDPGDWEWCLYMVERVGGTCKCNDIWSLWNCSSDHTEAFRCDNGNVEIEHCDGTGGCESMPNGVNDVCHLAAPSSDAGSKPASDGGVDGGAIAPSGSDASASSGSGDTADGSVSASGGCAVARAQNGMKAAGIWSAFSLFAAWALRRRRRA
jgi:hypothetical protein